VHPLSPVTGRRPKTLYDSGRSPKWGAAEKFDR
jgi:hypothetical protein